MFLITNNIHNKMLKMSYRHYIQHIYDVKQAFQTKLPTMKANDIRNVSSVNKDNTA